MSIDRVLILDYFNHETRAMAIYGEDMRGHTSNFLNPPKTKQSSSALGCADFLFFPAYAIEEKRIKRGQEDQSDNV